MCHSSPTISIFAAFLSVGGTAFYLTHIWKFDRLACLIPRRKEFFRWFMLLLLGLVVLGFTLYAVLESYVKYHEGYIAIPDLGVLPTPYPLWGERNSRIYRASQWFTVIAFCAMSSVHLEETCYWMYMLRACQRSGSAHWLKSVWFKIWAIGSLVFSGIFVGCTLINGDFAHIESNFYVAGSSVGATLLIGSVYMAVKFPGFIEEARRLGANQEVLSRLLYIRVLGNLRTVFRLAYVIILLMLSIDGFTHAQTINNTRLALDVLMIAAYFSIFAAETLTLWILLPRKSAQSTGRQIQSQQSANLMGARPMGVADRMGMDDPQTASAWSVLGNRLNLDRENVTEFNPDNSMLSPSTKELDDMPSVKGPSFKNRATSPIGVRWTPDTRDPQPDVPLYHRGQRDLNDLEMGRLNMPSALKDFQGPIDIRTSPDPKHLKVLVTNEVVRDH